jgi:small-conductance mechanosensitive channel
VDVSAAPIATAQALAPVIQEQLGWAPPWAISLIVIVTALVAALVAHALLVQVIRRALKRRDRFWRELVVRTRRPGRWAMVLVALAAALPLAPLEPKLAARLSHALLVGFILIVGWGAMTAVEIGSAIYMHRFRIDVADNLVARKHLTQVRILRRAMITLIVVVTVGLALMTIPGVRQWGISLLAAGGAAGLIVGLAMQPLLSNLIAGIQIAVTQPIRIDDAVFVEGETGNIEEINATYVVVRLWDQRRLIVPLSDFLQKPFQNWTRECASLLGTAMVYVDYTMPVDAVRRKVEEIVHASSLWDGRVCVLHVTELKERTMELRALVSAANSGQLFDLRSEVREKLVAWLQAEHAEALPKDRVVLRPAGREDDRELKSLRAAPVENRPQ